MKIKREMNVQVLRVISNDRYGDVTAVIS